MVTQQRDTNDMDDSDTDSSENKLIQLGDSSNSVGHAKDMNSKIDHLEHSLGDLNSELETIRDSVEEGLDRLGDTDMDLTSKVSDTYKRLGELDNTYKSLAEISGKIDTEIKKLTSDISQVASQSSAELEKLEATSEVHNSYMTKQNMALAERVEQLVKESHETSTRMQLSIKDVQETIIVAEHKLVAEIDSLANTTQSQSEILAENIDVANTEIESSKARIIKLQKVDEALDKRAFELERSSSELADRSKELEVTTGFLDSRTSKLQASVQKLIEHTEALQYESDNHGSLISDLQSKAARFANDLLDLGGTERKHFRMTLASLLLIALAVSGFVYYQLEDNQLVDADIIAVNHELGAYSNHVSQELVALNEKLADEVDVLSDKLVDVDKKVQSLDDQAQSLDGRVSAMSPMDNFGGDNILHGPQWLSELPKDKFMIQLASVSDKQELFEIAQRYNHYLTQPVSYFTDANGKYVMMYGQFDTDRIAQSVMQRMPYRINSQRPMVRSVDSVHNMI